MTEKVKFGVGNVVELDTGKSAEVFASIGLKDNTGYIIKKVVDKRVILKGYESHQIDQKWLILIRGNE